MNNQTTSLQGFSWHAMNTQWLIYAPWTRIEQARGAAVWQSMIVNQVEQFEQIASRFRTQSELRQWMDSGMVREHTASPILHQLLKDSLRYQTLTNGLFNIHFGKALIDAGYDESFEIVSQENEQSTNSLKSNGHEFDVIEPFQDVLCISDEQRIWKRPVNTTLDFGGIGKGWMVDRIIDFLQNTLNIPHGVVDAGGDLRVWTSESKLTFPVEIADPFDAEHAIAELTIENGAIATSSKWKRRWKKQNGKWNHHLIDPATKRPATTTVIQASVQTKNATEADVLAKCICILEPSESEAFLTKFQTVEQAWIVLENHSVFIWNRSQEGAPRWKTLNI